MIPRSLRRVAVRAARQGIDRLPVTTRELALALATRSDHGPTMLPGPPDGPVLVVAPHPDDEAIGPGATIARHVDAGHDVTVLVVTSGGATAGGGDDVLAVREDESRRALAHLGVGPERIVFGRLTDGNLPAERQAVVDLISRHAAGVATVYVPSLLDPHPDHHAVALAAGLADLSPDTDVHGYEVWAAGPVDVLVDVTDVFARKQAALGEYDVALETVDYVRSSSGLAAYRSATGGLGGRGFAEGFVAMPATEYADIVDRLIR